MDKEKKTMNNIKENPMNKEKIINKDLPLYNFYNIDNDSECLGYEPEYEEEYSSFNLFEDDDDYMDDDDFSCE